MQEYGVSDIQSKPSLIKAMDIGAIVDKRKHTTLGYYISAKYEAQVLPLIEEIDRQVKLAKLHKLKAYQDTAFAELGVDDGL